MDGDHRLFLTLTEQPHLERQVRRRAGNRCEGVLEDHEGMPSDRCKRRGAAVDLYLTFQGALGDEATARDIVLFFDDCYDRSETASAFAHFAHMLSKP
jgi:hypothetical protein